jgi:hypothetical protein
MTQTVQRVAGFQSSSFRSYGTGLVNLASKAAKLRVKSKNKSKFFIDKKNPALFMLSSMPFF